ncbi:hypothetical protein D3C79_697220 [compost metagenome]
MKQIIFFCAFFGLSSIARSQTNTFPSTGYVGIGTNSPATPLNMGSAANSTTSTIKLGTGHDQGNLSVPFMGISGGYNIDFAAWRDVIPDYIGARIRAERINTWQQNSALVQAMDLVFSTGEPGDNFPLAERLRIRYNGNIGIGTNNPQQKLSVKGKIQAEEIKVTTTSADWPDYVFEEGYKLNSLKDLEAFIKVNKHLPDMPTASEVEVNGIQLGEMVKKLLKNNEELTLHVISLQKQIEELKKGR